MGWIPEEQLRDVAAESEYHVDVLLETADTLQTALQEQLTDIFKKSRLDAGYDKWIAQEYDAFWIAMTVADLHLHLLEIGEDVDPDKLGLIGEAYLRLFRERGGALAVPLEVANSLEDPMFYPIAVELPDTFKDGQWFAYQQLMECVWRYDMTPSEALDYWVVNSLDVDTDFWSGRRGVSREAIRKNVRQAKSKWGDDEKGAAHQAESIRPVSLKDVPDGDMPIDEDEDFVYIT